MKINGVENVNRIVFSHKGKNLKFDCYTSPLKYDDNLNLHERKTAEIVFDDTAEVFSLITMLERFKNELEGYIGLWRCD